MDVLSHTKQLLNLLCIVYKYLWLRCFKRLKNPLRVGFEPTRALPIGFQVQRLNHSAIAAVGHYDRASQLRDRSGTSQSTVFHLCRDGSSWVKPVLIGHVIYMVLLPSGGTLQTMIFIKPNVLQVFETC